MSIELPKIESREAKMPLVFKRELTLAEYNQLLQRYGKERPKEVTYTYFDTDRSANQAKLFQDKLRFRVRKKNGQHRLELKIRKDTTTKFEVLDKISREQFNDMQSGIIPSGNVQLALMGLYNELPQVQRIDTVHSIRQKTSFHDGVLIIEKNTRESDARDNYEAEFRSMKEYSDKEIQDILEQELGISNEIVRKSKLQSFWDGK